MARSDLVVDLIKAGVEGDGGTSRRIAEAIAAEERAKRHSGVAHRIDRVLANINSPNSKSSQSRPRTRDGSGGISRKNPEFSYKQLYLNSNVRIGCDEVVEEQHRADLLRVQGLEPRHRILLVGPPGNGKTSLAEGIAYELALPMFRVQYDAVVTSYLGETAQRLKRLFDFVRTEPCVLFFDEFDAIGKERGDIHETGEIKRVVTTLLLNLDDLPSYCVLIAATNHPELLDRAAWRRFELKLELPNPSESEMLLYFTDQLRRMKDAPGYTAKRLFSAVKPKSFSDAENFFLDIQRRWVLNQGVSKLRLVIDDRIRAWQSRSELTQGVNYSDRKTNTKTQ